MNARDRSSCTGAGMHGDGSDDTVTGVRPEFRAVTHVSGRPTPLPHVGKCLIGCNAHDWPAAVPGNHLPDQGSDTGGRADYAKDETGNFHKLKFCQ